MASEYNIPTYDEDRGIDDGPKPEPDGEIVEPFKLGPSPEGEPSEDEEVSIAKMRVAEQLTENHLPAEAIAAFVCILDENGMWIGTSQVELASLISFKREANLADMIAGARAVSADAAAARDNQNLGAVLPQIAQLVVQAVDQRAQQMQEQMSAQQILRNLKGHKG